MTYEIKTKVTADDPRAFVERVAHPRRRADGLYLLERFADITGEAPALWGNAIIGYGSYDYRSKSGCVGTWMKSGFAPRRGKLVVYIMSGFGRYESELARLGKYKTGASCLYLNSLADVDCAVLEDMVRADYHRMGELYPA